MGTFHRGRGRYRVVAVRWRIAERLGEVEIEALAHLLKYAAVSGVGLGVMLYTNDPVTDLGRVIFWIAALSGGVKAAGSDVTRAIRATKTFGAVAVGSFLLWVGAASLMQPDLPPIPPQTTGGRVFVLAFGPTVAYPVVATVAVGGVTLVKVLLEYRGGTGGEEAIKS